MKTAVKLLEKNEFIECMENLGLKRTSDIAAFFGKSEQSVYKYMNEQSKTEIPNVVIQHLLTIALMEDDERQLAIIEAALKITVPSDIDGTDAYGEILKQHGIRDNAENIALMFGKSSASIYRANTRGGNKHDTAMAAHLRTLRLLKKDELATLIKGKFEKKPA